MGKPSRARRWRYVVSALFVAAGTTHFTSTDTLARIVPPYLPLHRELVLASGCAEIGGALGLAFGNSKVRRWSGLWLIATLVAVFPANVQMALHPELYPEVWGGRATLLARLPLQALAIAIVWFAMKSDVPTADLGSGTCAKPEPG
jgi:uncharacterized membrane protein